MTGAELRYVEKAFASNMIAPVGPMVDGLEADLCAFSGAEHCAALSSGTGALHLALLILGVKPDDDVICASFTFAASANPIVYVGATQVFVDYGTGRALSSGFARSLRKQARQRPLFVGLPSRPCSVIPDDFACAAFSLLPKQRYCQKFYKKYEKKNRLTRAGDESGLRVESLPIVHRSRRPLSSTEKGGKTGEKAEGRLTPCESKS